MPQPWTAAATSCGMRTLLPGVCLASACVGGEPGPGGDAKWIVRGQPNDGAPCGRRCPRGGRTVCHPGRPWGCNALSLRFPSADQALDRFAMKRYHDDKVSALMQPSQKRCVCPGRAQGRCAGGSGQEQEGGAPLQPGWATSCRERRPSLDRGGNDAAVGWGSLKSASTRCPQPGAPQVPESRGHVPRSGQCRPPEQTARCPQGTHSGLGHQQAGQLR